MTRELQELEVVVDAGEIQKSQDPEQQPQAHGKEASDSHHGGQNAQDENRQGMRFLDAGHESLSSAFFDAGFTVACAEAVGVHADSMTPRTKERKA